jgi:hypothetical protein
MVGSAAAGAATGAVAVGAVSTDGAAVVVVPAPAGKLVAVGSVEAVVALAEGVVVDVVVVDVVVVDVVDAVVGSVEAVVVGSVEAVVVDAVELAVGGDDAAVLRLPTVRKIPAAMTFKRKDGLNGCRRR